VRASVQELIYLLDDRLARLKVTASESPRPSLLANIRALEKERRGLQTALDELARERKPKEVKL